MPLIKLRRKPVIKEVGMHIQSNIREKDLRGTDVWLFYRKVLSIRGYKPLDIVKEIYTYNGRLQARLKYVFRQDKRRRVLVMHISRQEMLYFTVAKEDEVFQSEYCQNYTELDTQFCRYFKRGKPILPQKPGY